MVLFAYVGFLTLRTGSLYGAYVGHAGWNIFGFLPSAAFGFVRSPDSAGRVRASPLPHRKIGVFRVEPLLSTVGDEGRLGSPHASAPMRPHRRRGDYVEVEPAVVAERRRRPGATPSRRSSGMRDRATAARPRSTTTGPTCSVRRAEQFLRDHEIRSVADVTADKLRAFQAELLEAGLSVGTAATFHRIIRNFLGFCRREVGASAPRALEVHRLSRTPSSRRRSPRRRCSASSRPRRTGRDRFLIEFMLRTGLRLSEVARVTVDDIVTGTDGAYLRVRQRKGTSGTDRSAGHGQLPLLSGPCSAYLRNERPAGREGSTSVPVRRGESRSPGSTVRLERPRASRCSSVASARALGSVCTHTSSATPSRRERSQPASTHWCCNVPLGTRRRRWSIATHNPRPVMFWKRGVRAMTEHASPASQGGGSGRRAHGGST